MKPDLAAFIQQHVARAEESAVWGDGALPLCIRTYLSKEMPPLAYVTSVRALVFRDVEVLVVQDFKNSFHLTPGGRREMGETLEQTLHREILEETGWTIIRAALLGFMHFHHLAARPLDYPYPHPDFVQLIYVADAGQFVPEAQVPSEYELATGFRPITSAKILRQTASQRILLDAAIKLRNT